MAIASWNSTSTMTGMRNLLNMGRWSYMNRYSGKLWPSPISSANTASAPANHRAVVSPTSRATNPHSASSATTTPTNPFG